MARVDATRRDRGVTGRGLQLYRFQYVLAKLTQQVVILAYGETEGNRAGSPGRSESCPRQTSIDDA